MPSPLSKSSGLSWDGWAVRRKCWTQILAVEADFRELEVELSSKMDSVEEDYPGYDEYRYVIAPINHNPYELAALLSVLYEDYTEAEVKDYLTTIIDGQYDFTTNEEVEIRTRTETRWHWVTHYREEERTGFRWENGHLVEYTYTVQVPYDVLESYEVEVEYEYYILNVTLYLNVTFKSKYYRRYPYEEKRRTP